MEPDTPSGRETKPTTANWTHAEIWVTCLLVAIVSNISGWVSCSIWHGY